MSTKEKYSIINHLISCGYTAAEAELELALLQTEADQRKLIEGIDPYDSGRPISFL